MNGWFANAWILSELIRLPHFPAWHAGNETKAATRSPMKTTRKIKTIVLCATHDELIIVKDAAMLRFIAIVAFYLLDAITTAGS